MSLRGRVALITGAGRGIGAAAALRFAQAGAAVAVCDVDGAGAERTAAAVARATGQPSCAVQADVREPEAVARMVAEVGDPLGPVEILVNNAGILRNAPLGEMSDEDWTAVVDVSLKGSFVCSRAVRQSMVDRRYGKIVNVSSGAALGSSRGHANYSSAKAGIIGLTRTLALELGPSNINVNAVAPGAVDTEMTPHDCRAARHLVR